MKFMHYKTDSLIRFAFSSSHRSNQKNFANKAVYTTDSSGPELQPRPPRTKSLAGTVLYHTSYLFLHTQDTPESWPKTLTSPLFQKLKETLAKRDGLVNVSWSELTTPSTTPLTRCSETAEAYYGGTLWIKAEDRDICKGVQLPVVSSVTDIISIFDKLTDSNPTPYVVDSCAAENVSTCTGPYFYICCHGHRDCRCGIRGGHLADALTKELAKRDMLLNEQGRPRLGRVGHVGGHRNAPNLIIFPYGDWYGNLEPNDLPSLVDYYVQLLQTKTSLPFSTGPNRFQWRGRMGMTKLTQLAMFSNPLSEYTG